MNPEYYADIAARLARLQAEERLRRLPQGDFGLPMAISQGREYLNLSSNDYLGIAADKDLRDEFFAFARDLSFGSTGSRLMTGNSEPYRDFEQELEQAYGLPALVFGSGFQANTGILPALAERGDLVLADRLVHASIIDGVLACKADFLRYRHNDYDHLESLLAKNASKYRYVWIVSETIFSMDGDRADVARLVELKRKYGALLYLDQAHSIGTDGSTGLGVCAPDGRWSAVDVSVFPMGKAMASHGAFVVTRPEIKDYLVNTSRPMIFSTALPPVCVAWSAYVFRKMRSMQASRRRLAGLSDRLRGELSALGYAVLGSSHIVPVVFGSNRAALDAAAALVGQGIWATAIRYPTVPQGQARLRLSLSSALSDQQVERTIQVFKHLKTTSDAKPVAE